MALTYTNEVELMGVSRTDGVVQRVVGCTVTFDDSYPTGGEAIVASDIEPALGGAMSAVDFVVIGSSREAGTEVVLWDRSEAKLLVFTADGTQAANASDQSAVTAEILVYGR